MKICTKCKKEKPFEAFNYSKGNKTLEEWQNTKQELIEARDKKL